MTIIIIIIIIIIISIFMYSYLKLYNNVWPTSLFEVIIVWWWLSFVLYTLPMNINGYVPFLINTLDTSMTGVNMLTK